MSAANPAWLETIDFLASGTTPEALIAFRPSEAAQRRVEDLTAREHHGVLTPEEQQELADTLQLEHLMILAKAQARQKLLSGLRLTTPPAEPSPNALMAAANTACASLDPLTGDLVPLFNPRPSARATTSEPTAHSSNH